MGNGVPGKGKCSLRAQGGAYCGREKYRVGGGRCRRAGLTYGGVWALSSNVGQGAVICSQSGQHPSD